MLILQVADIHFRHPECTTAMDPDRPFRTALVNDVRARRAQLGKFDAILVVGDIAFKGIADEYAAALTWLTTLADAAGCSLEDIFVVPGNHDVDRGIIRSRRAVTNAQRAIASAPHSQRERELLGQFRDEQTGPALLEPIAEYNKFAARFNCQVYAPDKLFWHQERDLTDGYRVRFHGLTSTLLSGAGAPANQEDTRQSLYLSPLQTAFDPVAGMINVVLMHHPPDWFMDHDDRDDAIRGGTHLQFFGHKHRQRITRDARYMRLAAGAVNPDRNEVGWEPGYNAVRLTIAREGPSTFLALEAHLFRWQTDPDGFQPKFDGDQPVFKHKVPVPTLPMSANATERASVVKAPQPPDASVATPSKADAEVSMSEPQTRNLVYRFWDLASSERREIAQRLDLVTDEEMRLAEPERYGRALMRAAQLGLLDRLAAEIEGFERRTGR